MKHREKRKDFLGDKKEWLIKRLCEAANQNNKPLSKGMLKNMAGYPSTTVYEKYFGSWNKAKETADLLIIPPTNTRRSDSRNYREVPLKLRFMILQRDDFTCQYCGRNPKDGAKLMIDHIVPFSKNGLTNKDNLITACFECNIGKRDALIDFNVSKRGCK